MNPTYPRRPIVPVPPPSYLSEPQVQYLSRLVEEVRNGNILIPKFQREFVWSPEQRLELLHSVKEGIPIGSLLVWRTSQVDLKTFSDLAGFCMPPPPQPTPGASRQYLLDGHQRLSTLFGALNHVASTRVPHQIQEEPKYFYDLNKEDFILAYPKEPEILLYGLLVGSKLLPTNIIFDSIALLRFQRELEDNSYIERIDMLSNVFRNYKIPIIPLVTDNLEEATKAFQRINSSGTTMSDFHMVAALTFKGDAFDLTALMDHAKEELQEVGWESLDEKYILATIRAHEGLNIASPNADATSKALGKNPKLVELATENLKKAAFFLKENCGIYSPQLLPYSYQAVVLAEALSGEPTPSSSARSELGKWFWRTAYTAYFLGARDKEVNNALQDARQLAKGKLLERGGESGQKVEPLPNRHDFRNARSKAFLMRLAELSPLGFDGQPFEAYRCLGEYGPRAALQLVSSQDCNLSGVSGPENRFLVKPEAAHDFREFLLKKVDIAPGIPFMNSHALDLDMIECLRSRQYEEFFTKRRLLLLKIEAKFVEELGLVYAIPMGTEKNGR
jgi:hypothetical protein